MNSAATDTGNHRYDLLRYGAKVQPEAGEKTATVWLIDWTHPENSHYAIAEEVAVKGADAKRVALTTTDIVSCLAYR